MEDYFFRLKQMTVGYQKRPLIKEIELGLKAGEILTLIGLSLIHISEPTRR